MRLSDLENAKPDEEDTGRVITHDMRSSSNSGSGSTTDYSGEISANSSAIGDNATAIKSNTNAINKNAKDIKIIKDNQSHIIQSSSDFPTLLQMEFSKGIDQDGDKEVFGYTYYFDEITNGLLPSSIRSINNKFYKGTDDPKKKNQNSDEYNSVQPKGRLDGICHKVSFQEYYDKLKSLGSGHYIDITIKTAKEFGRISGLLK